MSEKNHILLFQVNQDLKLKGIKNYCLDFLISERPDMLKVKPNEMLYIYYFGSQSNLFKVKVMSELDEHTYHQTNCRKPSEGFYESQFITKHLSDVSFQSEGSFYIHYLKVKILPHEKN